MTSQASRLATYISSMNLIAIDPGTVESGVVEFCDGRVSNAAMWPNELLIERLVDGSKDERLCIEMVAHYGMPVGAEVFQTCVWIGEFKRQWKLTTGKDAILVFRRDIKLYLCGSLQAKDPNVRRALIDKFGPPGTKKNPGKTYGLKSHLWAAFALAVYVSETQSPSADSLRTGTPTQL